MRTYHVFAISLSALVPLALACTPSAPSTPASPASTVAPSTADATAPGATAPRGAPSPASAERKLLCARIGVVTSAREPKGVNLDKLSAEGGRADVFVDGDSMRIAAELLGETSREQVDYRFDKGQIVCAHEMRTTLHTVMGGKTDGTGPPPSWRVDFRVFAGTGDVVHETFDEAPGPDESHRTPTETIAFAKELLALAR